MNVQKLLNYISKPDIYEPGNALMWTDPHISKQLLEVHLNDQTDLASRKSDTIDLTVNWILKHSNSDQRLKILDLGCGPGLYAEQFASKGHEVMGIDISPNSIEYAQRQARKKSLDIKYLCQDYVDTPLPAGPFDLIILIYVDFCPLLPAQRERLLQNVKQSLKPGGRFIFDFSNDLHVTDKVAAKNWEVAEQGFWSGQPYLALADSYCYEEEKVWLYQHMILSEDDEVRCYRFWHHYFSQSDIEEQLTLLGFKKVTFHEHVIPSGDGYSSDEVTFCVVEGIAESDKR